MTLSEFRAKLRARFVAEHRIHAEVALLLEPGVAAPRKLLDATHIALDMLFVQTYKAHLSVLGVADFGHMEDAATLTRRLLELAVTAAYIGMAGTPRDHDQRARRYLADLWQELPPEGRNVLPPPVQEQWASLTMGVPRGALPKVQKMFSELNQQAAYDLDYDLLSRIAHGASSDQLVAYTSNPVQVRATWHIGALLVYASRYYLATAFAWNAHFHGFSDAELQSLVEKIDAWAASARPEADGSTEP